MQTDLSSLESQAKRLLGEIQHQTQHRQNLLEELAWLLQGRIYGWVRLITGQDADALNATQQTLLQIIKSVDTYDLNKAALPWLRTIACREAVAIVAKRNRAGLSAGDTDGEFEDYDSDPVQLQIHEEQLDQLRTCLERLDATYRMPVVMSYFQELSHKDVSDILGITIVNVRQRVSRAYEKLRTCMQRGEQSEQSRATTTGEGV